MIMIMIQGAVRGKAHKLIRVLIDYNHDAVID